MEGLKKNDRVILVESRSFKIVGQKLVLVVSGSDRTGWFRMDLVQLYPSRIADTLDMSLLKNQG